MGKLKKGDKVKFPFAGSMHIGVFINTEDIEYGTVKRTYYKCRGKDGILYPLDKDVIEKI
jgi:hypothetical protein